MTVARWGLRVRSKEWTASCRDDNCEGPDLAGQHQGLPASSSPVIPAPLLPRHSGEGRNRGGASSQGKVNDEGPRHEQIVGSRSSPSNIDTWTLILISLRQFSGRWYEDRKRAGTSAGLWCILSLWEGIMKETKTSPTTKLDVRGIKARKEWMERWTHNTTEYLQPSVIKRSLRSWQGVARSGLRPPKVTPKHTGGQRG